MSVVCQCACCVLCSGSGEIYDSDDLYTYRVSMRILLREHSRDVGPRLTPRVER